MKIERSRAYIKWFEKLKDAVAKHLIFTRLERIRVTDSFGDTRALGDGVSEIKIDYGPGYRLYYTMRGAKVVFLLVGADKSRQEEDIKRAKKMLRKLEKEWKL